MDCWHGRQVFLRHCMARIVTSDEGIEFIFVCTTKYFDDGDAKEPQDYRDITTIIPLHPIPECRAS